MKEETLLPSRLKTQSGEANAGALKAPSVALPTLGGIRGDVTLGVRTPSEPRSKGKKRVRSRTRRNTV